MKLLAWKHDEYNNDPPEIIWLKSTMPSYTHIVQFSYKNTCTNWSYPNGSTNGLTHTKSFTSRLESLKPMVLLGSPFAIWIFLLSRKVGNSADNSNNNIHCCCCYWIVSSCLENESYPFSMKHGPQWLVHPPLLIPGGTRNERQSEWVS